MVVQPDILEKVEPDQIKRDIQELVETISNMHAIKFIALDIGPR